MTAATWQEHPASTKQISTIVTASERLGDLVDKNTQGHEVEYERMMDVLGGKFVTKGEASDTISWLFSLSSRPQASKGEETQKEAQAGYYVDGDDVFVVVISKRSGHPYAKQLTVSRNADGSVRHVSWEYAPRVAYRLASMAPLTVEEAGRLGHLYGHCIICCAALTDPKSVERGIGPVCAKKVG
jgi:hypothetical protein